MSTTLRGPVLLVKDPDTVKTYTFDWDQENLAASATIVTSTWSISGPDNLLTQDQDAILTGSRKTRIRLTAGTLNARYTVTNRIVTNETPAQTKDHTLEVLVQPE